jgi:hypothetical protein
MANAPGARLASAEPRVRILNISPVSQVANAILATHMRLGPQT